MKKAALILALIGSVFAYGQTKDTLRLDVNGSEIIILTDDVNNLSETDFNGIIQRLTAETKRIVARFNNEVAEINRREKAGEITAEEAEDQREKASENMEAEIEALNEEIENWADRYGEQVEENATEVDAWADQWESNAEKYETANQEETVVEIENEEKKTTVVIDDDGVHINTDEIDPDIEKKREEYKKNQTIGIFEWHLGWNNWVNANGLATNEGPVNGINQTTELNFWPSMTWGIGFGGKTRFGQSKMYVRYGAQFNWHFFRLKGNTIIEKSNDDFFNFDGVYFANDANNAYEKSSFRVSYIDVPVMLEFDASKPGKSNCFSLAVGGYGGLRTKGLRVLEYSDFNGDKTDQRTKNNYYTNGYRYGLLAQIGFGTFKITGKYDLNPLFRTDRNTPDYQIASLTLGWVMP